jgi:hypothetical protein
VEATQQKKKESKKPKPEEQAEGVPQCQHCPPEKRRGGHCTIFKYWNIGFAGTGTFFAGTGT